MLFSILLRKLHSQIFKNRCLSNGEIPTTKSKQKQQKVFHNFEYGDKIYSRKVDIYSCRSKIFSNQKHEDKFVNCTQLFLCFKLNKIEFLYFYPIDVVIVFLQQNFCNRIVLYRCLFFTIRTPRFVSPQTADFLTTVLCACRWCYHTTGISRIFAIDFKHMLNYICRYLFVA